MNKIFKDDLLDKAFKDNGFVVLPKVNNSVAEKLLKACETIHPAFSATDFFTTTHSSDLVYRQLCDATIQLLLAPPFESVFENYAPLYANFMIKPPSQNSVCGLHQDWTFVDETQYASLNVWMALEDINLTNGCIHVIPSSHRLPFPVRGRNMHSAFSNAYQQMVDELLEPVPLAAGECVVFNSALLHYSPNNLSARNRVAASLMFYPAAAELIHYIYSTKNPKQATRHKVPVEFFLQYGSAESVSLEGGETVEVNMHSFGFEEIKRLLVGG